MVLAELGNRWAELPEAMPMFSGRSKTSFRALSRRSSDSSANGRDSTPVRSFAPSAAWQSRTYQ